MIIERFKTLWANTSQYTKKWIGVRLFYVIIGVIVLKLVFVDKDAQVIIQQQRDVYRDSLVVERERTRILKQILINDKIQDEKDSLALRTYNVDSLIGYISTVQVVARSTH